MKWHPRLFITFKCWHPFRVHLKYICIESHICWDYKKNWAVNNLNVQVILLCLESWTSQWHHPVLEELGTMSLDDSEWPVVQASIIYQQQLSTLCLNENKAAMIIYKLSIPCGIDLDHCSTHPEITEIDKTILVLRGFEPRILPLRFQLNDWLTH